MTSRLGQQVFSTPSKGPSKILPLEGKKLSGPSSWVNNENAENGGAERGKWAKKTNDMTTRSSNSVRSPLTASNKVAIKATAPYEDGRSHNESAQLDGQEKRVSVKELKGWLSDFEKQQQGHFQKNQPAGMKPTDSLATIKGVSTPSKDPAIKCGGSSSLLSTPTCGLSSSHGSLGSVSRKGPGGTPGSATRFGKSRVKRQDVEATDEGYASVQKLSEWLGDDPFEKRKRAMRKGAHVGAASQKFDPGQKITVTRDIDQFKNGNVADRQKWLKDVFGNGEENADDMSTVSQKAKWLETAVTKHGIKALAVKNVGHKSETRSFESNACKGEGIPTPEEKRGSDIPSEQSVVHSFEACDHVMGAALSTTGTRDSIGTCDEKETLAKAPSNHLRNNAKNDAPRRNHTATIVDSSESTNNCKQTQTASIIAAAAAFGGTAKPKTSVQRRREALEQLGKETRKMADPRSAMLKTTWESHGSSAGGGVYTKRKIDAIAPKKNLSDLP